MATALHSSARQSRHRVARSAPAPLLRSLPISLVVLGLLAVLVAAWGGIAPYVGPAVRLTIDDPVAWHWSSAHAALALAPGAVAFLAGLVLIAIAPWTVDGRGRGTVAFAGAVLVVCGAWFATGPLVWPVVSSHGGYLVVAAPLRQLAEALAASIGPGLVLAACGGVAVGWALRHRPSVPTEPASVVLQPVPGAVAAMPGAAGRGIGPVWPASSAPGEPVRPHDTLGAEAGWASEPFVPMVEVPVVESAGGAAPAPGTTSLAEPAVDESAVAGSTVDEPPMADVGTVPVDGLEVWPAAYEPQEPLDKWESPWPTPTPERRWWFDPEQGDEGEASTQAATDAPPGPIPAAPPPLVEDLPLWSGPEIRVGSDAPEAPASLAPEPPIFHTSTRNEAVRPETPSTATSSSHPGVQRPPPGWQRPDLTEPPKNR